MKRIGLIAPRFHPGNRLPAKPGTAMRVRAGTCAAGLLLWAGGAGGALADPPAAAGSASPGAPAPAPTPSGNFLSSVKQAFNQNFEHEVVRGHFDVGTPPDAHRYYCLVDAKTGKREPNGVGGQPFSRPDGMTGLKEGAVSFYSCVSAEQQGMLVTDVYVLSDAAKGPGAANNSAASTRPTAAGTAATSATGINAPTAPPAAATTAAAAAVPPAPAASAQAPEPPLDRYPSDSLLQTEVRAAYARFIAGQNAHDPAAISSLLLDSEDFVWAQMRGNSIWGHTEAMEAFQNNWKGSYRLDPQLEQLRISAVAPGVAVLITPLLLTQGNPGGKPATIPVRWGGVFVKTASGWRISSIFITPFEGWKAGG